MSVHAHQIIMRPIVTEESQIQSTKGPRYTFRVAVAANKQQIRDAIEQTFPNVRVVSVNTMNYAGKASGRMRTGRAGHKSRWKKAIVTLRAGDEIDLF